MTESTELTPLSLAGIAPPEAEAPPPALMQDPSVLAYPDATVMVEQDAPPPNPPSVSLDGRAKAAIIVRFLLNEGADLPLEDLPDDLQAKLADQMGRMGLVHRDTLSAVANEFAEQLDGVGLTFPHGLPGALTALEGQISAQTARRLRKEAGVRQYGDPWKRLRDHPAEDLKPLVISESTEVAAILLSKLDVGHAAKLLSILPGPIARRVTCAMSRIGKVTPEAVDRIGLSLAGQLDLRPEPALSQTPEDRMGDILNQSSPDTRDDMLEALDQTDEPFAEKVRRRIIIFAHIPARVMPADVPRIIREVGDDLLIATLACKKSAADTESTDFLLANISQRLAGNLREQAEDQPPTSEHDGQSAMTAIVAAIRRLELAGDINLLPAEDDTD